MHVESRKREGEEAERVTSQSLSDHNRKTGGEKPRYNYAAVVTVVVFV